jgi:hypothetical protein
MTGLIAAVAKRVAGNDPKHQGELAVARGQLLVDAKHGPYTPEAAARRREVGTLIRRM